KSDKAKSGEKSATPGRVVARPPAGVVEGLEGRVLMSASGGHFTLAPLNPAHGRQHTAPAADRHHSRPAAGFGQRSGGAAWDLARDNLVTFRDLNDPRDQGPGKITDVNADGRIDAPDLLATYNADGTGGWADGVNQDGNKYSYTVNGGTTSRQYTDDLVGW